MYLDVKARNLSTEARKLQTIQNTMLRMIFGFRMQDMVNMEKLRAEIGMFSVNQMNCYHVLIEAFNVMVHQKVYKKNGDQKLKIFIVTEEQIM